MALRQVFAIYGVSGKLAYGDSEFTAAHIYCSVRNWVIFNRIPSVAFPHIKNRAAKSFKTVKPLIFHNAAHDGWLNIDVFWSALLQYRNTHDRDTTLSPVMCILVRYTRDFIPVHPGQ